MRGAMGSVGPVCLPPNALQAFVGSACTPNGRTSQKRFSTELSWNDLSALVMFHSSEMQFQTERVLLTSMQFLQDVMNHRLLDFLLKDFINSESLFKQTLHNGKQGQTDVNMKTLTCRNQIPSAVSSQLIPSSLMQTTGHFPNDRVPSGRVASAPLAVHPT